MENIEIEEARKLVEEADAKARVETEMLFNEELTALCKKYNVALQMKLVIEPVKK